MDNFITLHLNQDGAVALVSVEYIEQIAPFEHDHSTIYYPSGNFCNYKESVQEIQAKIRELDAEPYPVQRPAPSNMGPVESKHGRVT